MFVAVRKIKVQNFSGNIQQRLHHSTHYTKHDLSKGWKNVFVFISS